MNLTKNQLNKIKDAVSILSQLIKEQKTNKLYILSPKIKWKTFKELNDRIVKDSGPTPVGGDKALWHLLRDKKIYCWFASDMKNDMGLGLEIPKRYDNWEKCEITSGDCKSN